MLAMGRIRYLENNEYPYHISSRCINKEWFGLPMEQVWNIFSEQLFFLHYAFNIKIHAFVLMSNHYHLILKTPGNNLSDGMKYFLREVSRNITAESKRINQTFGGRYFRSQINSYHYYLHAYKYLYLNPVKAGLCDRVENYKYSTLNGVLGFNKMIIPIEEDPLIFSEDVNDTLNWLNEVPSEENWKTVGSALRRNIFKLRKNRG